MWLYGPGGGGGAELVMGFCVFRVAYRIFQGY